MIVFLYKVKQQKHIHFFFNFTKKSKKLNRNKCKSLIPKLQKQIEPFKNLYGKAQMFKIQISKILKTPSERRINTILYYTVLCPDTNAIKISGQQPNLYMKTCICVSMVRFKDGNIRCVKEF